MVPNLNLENWRFEFGGGPAVLKGTPHYQEPDILCLPFHVDLLRYLSNNDQQDVAIQSQVQMRLGDDATAQLWHGQRNVIGSLPHFGRYRKSGDCDLFHAAAKAVAIGTATSEQSLMVQGLDQEITESAVILPAGQILFHGRGDQGLTASSSYPSFISTSLDPVVCVYHANKRKNQLVGISQPIIYALTLRDDLPAIWGNGGALNEWELLLESKLKCELATISPGRRFDVIEATIGR